jgi:hypothetical protein
MVWRLSGFAVQRTAACASLCFEVFFSFFLVQKAKSAAAVVEDQQLQTHGITRRKATQMEVSRAADGWPVDCS